MPEAGAARGVPVLSELMFSAADAAYTNRGNAAMNQAISQAVSQAVSQATGHGIHVLYLPGQIALGRPSALAALVMLGSIAVAVFMLGKRGA